MCDTKSFYGGKGEIAKSVHNAAKHNNVSHKAYAVLAEKGKGF